MGPEVLQAKRKAEEKKAADEQRRLELEARAKVPRLKWAQENKMQRAGRGGRGRVGELEELLSELSDLLDMAERGVPC